LIVGQCARIKETAEMEEKGFWGCEKRHGIGEIGFCEDAVTQWEVVGCIPRISEQHLQPLFEAMLAQYPFPILGLHFDN
jgi:hypothetical protein